MGTDICDNLPHILAEHRKWCVGEGGARANLARADLARANLARANLAGAYLARANLAGANLADANLADANLAGANLAGADLADADLAGANLAGADLIDGGQDSRGFRFWAWHKDGVITYRAGCHTWTDVVAALVYYGDGYPSDGDRFDCAARLHFMHQIAQKRWSV